MSADEIGVSRSREDVDVGLLHCNTMWTSVLKLEVVCFSEMLVSATSPHGDTTQNIIIINLTVGFLFTGFLGKRLHVCYSVLQNVSFMIGCILLKIKTLQLI
jgi:hypothetical protein